MGLPALHMLTAEYRAAATQLADLDLPPEVVRDTLEGMTGDIEAKAQNVAHMARALDADAEAMKAWAKQATERAKAAERRAADLREYLAACLAGAGITAVKAPGISLSFRASTAVDVFQPELIPAQYMRQKPPPEPEPDKTAIAAALKAGQDVPGCRLERRQTLQIR